MNNATSQADKQSPQEPQPSTFLTDYDIAEEVGVGVESVRRWMRRGDLPAVKMGRHWRVPRPVWERFLSTGEWS
jgi:excisionase family DNA binding protein